MTTPHPKHTCRRITTAFLPSAGLLALVIAAVAGILGMHVITGGGHGGHSMAGAASSAAAGPASAAPASAAPAAAATPAHDLHQKHGRHAEHQGTDAAGDAAPEGDSCSGTCTGLHTAAASCTPSAKTGSLSAPLPGTSAFGVITSAAAAFPAALGCSYVPAGPSPGELSISRT